MKHDFYIKEIMDSGCRLFTQSNTEQTRVHNAIKYNKEHL